MHLGWMALDAPDWHVAPARVANVRRWTRPPGDLLTLTLEEAPGLPFPLLELPRLRAWTRHRLTLRDAALVSCEVWEEAGLRGLCTMAKYPDQDAYMAELCLPFAGFQFRLDHLAQPFGVLGDRECVALQASQQRGVPFYRDLYEPENQEGPMVRSLADDEEWDTHFPDHPLARLRAWLRVLPGRLRLHRGLLEAAAGPDSPGSAAEFLHRARAHRTLGDTRAALADCTRALQLEPDRDDGYFTRARLHLEAGAWQEAEGDLLRAIQRQPGMAAYHYYLSLALHRSGRQKEAVARYTEAQRLDPRCGRLG